MNITKIYTKAMHAALQNALKQGFRLDYKPQGGFIKFLYNTKEGVVFRYNTYLPITSSIKKDAFLNYSYEQAIIDLTNIYNKCITDNTYQLKNEFFKDRYGLKL